MTAAALHIDPRMRARRIAVLRARGRRRLKLLAGATVLALAGLGAWGLSLTSLVDVDRIMITGVTSSRASEIFHSTELRAGMPMLFLDVEGIESSVSALSWVKSARVDRDWPATVRIDVVPRVPAAVVPAGDGRSALIDANAHVVAWVGSGDGATAAATALPHLSVPYGGSLGGIHTAADGPLAAAAAIPGDLGFWVTTVTLDPAGTELGLLLQGGATVRLGAPVLLEEKMSAMRAMLAGADLECVSQIDVTMPDIATVRRHRSCAVS